MTQQPDIRHAMDVVGPPDPNDWKIEPTKHAGKFNETAPALATILNRSDVQATAGQYQRHDTSAVDAQKRFKHAAACAGWAVAATTAAGASILCVGNFKDLFPDNSWLETILFAIASVATIILGALATMYINRLRGGNLLQRWLQSRAEAERRRLEFFEAVIKQIPPDAETDVKVDLLRFEYVRRFLLDSQLAYFQKRSREHDAEAEKTLDWASWATCAATVFAGLAGILAVINAYLAVLAVVGVIATALATVMAGRENINQDRRNAERYSATCTSLEDLSKQLSTMREGLAKGDRQVLDNFFDALREVLLSEHTQWLEESKRKSAAIAKLEETLKKHSSEPPKHTA